MIVLNIKNLLHKSVENSISFNLYCISSDHNNAIDKELKKKMHAIRGYHFILLYAASH